MDPFAAPRGDGEADRERNPGRIGVYVRVMMILDIIFSCLGLLTYLAMVVVALLGDRLGEVLKELHAQQQSAELVWLVAGIGLAGSALGIAAAILILSHRRSGLRLGWLSATLYVVGSVVQFATQDAFAEIRGVADPLARGIGMAIMAVTVLLGLGYFVLYVIALIRAERELSPATAR